MKLKPGDTIRLTTDCTKWLSDNADFLYGYPDLIRNRKTSVFESDLIFDSTVQEQLCEYFMNKYSYIRSLNIDGVVVGDNGSNYSDHFAYLVWCGNELGEEITFIEPKYLEKL